MEESDVPVVESGKEACRDLSHAHRISPKLCIDMRLQAQPHLVFKAVFCILLIHAIVAGEFHIFSLLLQA
jgi:hypothetical protein